jgi:P pilus assembly chaperone PapD
LVKQSPKSNKNYKANVSDLVEVTKKGDKFRSFDLSINNTGDNIIDGNVYLALANMETANEEKFPAKKVTVYPGYSRTVNLQLPQEIKAGNYALAAILDYGHRQPLEGTQIMLEVK